MKDASVPLKVQGGPFAELMRRGAKALRKPPRVVELPLAAWADNQADKPAAPIPIGLRIGDHEAERRAEAAAQKAVETYASHGESDDKIAAYNNALIAELVACSTCQAADVTQAFFEMAALDVTRRLTTDGIQRLWQELQTLRTGSEVAMPELDVEGLAHLTAMLDRGVGFDHMPREEAIRLRRSLEHVRVVLGEAEERAERRGVVLMDFGTPRQPAEEPRDDVKSVLKAMECRQKRA